MKSRVPPLLALLLGVGGGAAAGLYWLMGQAERLIAAREFTVEAAVEAGRPPKPWDFWTLEIENLARELSEARTALERRETRVVEREARLVEEAREVEQLRAQVESLRGEIDRRLTTIEADEVRNLRQLAATYSLLPPRVAITIINELDDTTVTKLFALMKPEQAAALLGELSTQPDRSGRFVKRAAEISQRLRLLHTAPTS